MTQTESQADESRLKIEKSAAVKPPTESDILSDHFQNSFYCTPVASSGDTATSETSPGDTATRDIPSRLFFVEVPEIG